MGDNGAGPAQCASLEGNQHNSFIPPVPIKLAPNLASSAVPKFQLLQAVATCSPHLVRRPRPLWFKTSVLPSFAIGSATKYSSKVLVNVVTKSLVFPQRFLATKPTTKCLHIPKLHFPSGYKQHLACSIVPCIAPAAPLPSTEACSTMPTMVITYQCLVHKQVPC